ncbi:MAG: DUF354 domain-containing protein [Planctomycetota bacterium]
MRVLVDIVDTGHVQFFRPIIERLLAEGHQVKVTARQKDITLYLLDKFHISYQSISRMGQGLLGLGWELFRRDIKLFQIARKFRPDVILAQTGVSAARVGWLLRIPTVVLEECEHAKLQRILSLPFATRIMTGTGYLHSHGKRQRCFRGVWVQPYLDPRRFQPQKQPLLKAGVNPDEPYIVLRVVAWQAAHDFGHQGIDENTLIKAVDHLERHGRVLISAEKPLPPSLADHVNPVSPEDVHHLLAFARLYIGEGATMAAEAGVLGTPSIKCNSLDYGYLLAMEKDYELVRNTYTIQQGLEVAETLLADPDLDMKWKRKAERLWQQTDDLVDFTCSIINEARSQ